MLYKKILSSLLLLASFTLYACKKDKTASCTCDPGIVCTGNFAFISVNVKDNAGNPVVLDSYYTVKISSNDTFYLQDKLILDSASVYQGSAVLWSDTQLLNTARCGEDIQFIGIKSGRVVAGRLYTVGHDCCHIQLKDGDLNIVVN